MRIKVISLNLWHGGKLTPQIVDFLRAEDPDILLCQEVYNGTEPTLPTNLRTMQFFKKTFTFTNALFMPAFFNTDKQTDVGNAIFAKFPLTAQNSPFLNEAYREYNEEGRQDFADQPGVLQYVTVAAPAGELNVFNMHGVWDLDGDNYSARRQAMSKTILEATAGKTNVIVAGDSNAKYSNQAMRAIETQLPSVFGDSLTSTFNMRRKDNPGYATAAVDVMYISDSLRVVDKKCPDVDISDHLPLIAIIELPDTNE